MENGCAFCDKKNFEERIIKETEHWYVVASLGQITDGGHVLVVPKRHLLCMGEVRELKSLRCISAAVHRALIRVYANGLMSRYDSVMAFEHGIVGQTVFHAHLHFLPARLYITDKIRRDFPAAEIESIPVGGSLQELYLARRKPYLYWMMPNGQEMVCWNPPASPRYFRELFAKRLGHLERVDWKQVDPAHDRMLWSTTVAALKPELQ